MAALRDFDDPWPTDADTKHIVDEDYGQHVGLGTVEDYGDWFDEGTVIAEFHDALNQLQGALDERYALLRDIATMFGTAA